MANTKGQYKKHMLQLDTEAGTWILIQSAYKLQTLWTVSEICQLCLQLRKRLMKYESWQSYLTVVGLPKNCFCLEVQRQNDHTGSNYGSSSTKSRNLDHLTSSDSSGLANKLRYRPLSIPWFHIHLYQLLIWTTVYLCKHIIRHTY